MSSPFVLKSKNVLTYRWQESRPATILINDGKIEKISDYKQSFPGLAIHDHQELTIMSGLVDTHAHINEPGRTEWEGFATATRAAAAGGITTVIDMPLNSIPATTSLASLQTKINSAKNNCSIDYGFWGGVIPGNADELEAMIRAGIMGFKCFLCPSGVDEFPHCSRADLEIAMPILARHKIPLLVHAELEAPVSSRYTDPSDYRTYLESRPDQWEVNAICMMIDLAKMTGCQVHIVHLSAAQALLNIHEAQQAGVPITVETCPHYLVFAAEEIHSGATHFKCAPPVRGRQNRDQLWQGIKDRTIEFIVSDHSPCLPALKLMESGDFQKAWGGIAGLQFSMSSVWTEMQARNFSLFDLTDMMSYRTAKFLGLEQQKGQIQEGCDADLVIWDPKTEFIVDSEHIFHRHKVTPYLGKKLFGKVEMTYLRGQKIFAQNKFLNSGVGHEVLRRP